MNEGVGFLEACAEDAAGAMIFEAARDYAVTVREECGGHRVAFEAVQSTTIEVKRDRFASRAGLQRVWAWRTHEPAPLCPARTVSPVWPMR